MDPERDPGTTHINELFARGDTVLLPLASWLCPDGEHCVRDLASGDLVRYDGVHFTDAGAVAAAQWLGPQLRAVALSSRTPPTTDPGLVSPPSTPSTPATPSAPSTTP